MRDFYDTPRNATEVDGLRTIEAQAPKEGENGADDTETYTYGLPRGEADIPHEQFVAHDANR